VLRAGTEQRAEDLFHVVGFQAKVTFRRCGSLARFSSASRPMKSWSNFTITP
jgi:hypothetical protein